MRATAPTQSATRRQSAAATRCPSRATLSRSPRHRSPSLWSRRPLTPPAASPTEAACAQPLLASPPPSSCGLMTNSDGPRSWEARSSRRWRPSYGLMSRHSLLPPPLAPGWAAPAEERRRPSTPPPSARQIASPPAQTASPSRSPISATAATRVVTPSSARATMSSRCCARASQSAARPFHSVSSPARRTRMHVCCAVRVCGLPRPG